MKDVLQHGQMVQSSENVRQSHRVFEKGVGMWGSGSIAEESSILFDDNLKIDVKFWGS